MKLLNIACGDRIHKDWINIDFSRSSKLVKRVNVLEGLPFEDNSIDVVYSSHFFEHISKEDSDYILSEIYRVLKKQGIVRIVVPDLQNLCEEYLNVLSNMDKQGNKYKYDWITTELLDQMVRSSRGGDMIKILLDKETENNSVLVEYIKERVGENVINHKEQAFTVKEKLKLFKLEKMPEILLYSYLKLIKLFIPKNVRKNLFLDTKVGERHVWMYDKYSLGEKLNKAGFLQVEFMKHDESRIPSFSSYHLDTNEDGTPYKGCSSIYCEAVK